MLKEGIQYAHEIFCEMRVRHVRPTRSLLLADVGATSARSETALRAEVDFTDELQLLSDLVAGFS
jgi:hypothetical protein